MINDMLKNNSIQLFFIYVPNQQLQGQLEKEHSVDIINYITKKQNHNDKSHKASLENSTVERPLFLPYI
jgi:hypothetical protein